MKHKIIYIMSAFLLLNSCYKDLSTEAYITYPEIDVAVSGNMISVSYGEEFVFEPEFSQKGYSVEDFDFLWEIDLYAGRQADRIELGTGPKLEYKVANNPSSDPYTLSLTITNRELGFSKVVSWPVYVSSSLGEGLLVAHTRDNGATSDFDLVAAAPITYGYTAEEPRYVRNLYSFANDGEMIEGTVNQMSAFVSSNNAVYNLNEISYGTDNGLFTVDVLNYKKAREGGELFYNYEAAIYRTTAVFNYASAIHGAIVNDRFYTVICNGDCHYNPTRCSATPNDFFRRENTAYAKLDQGSICTFNPNDGKFYFVRGWMSLNGGFAPVNASTSFDAVGAECIGAGGLNQMNMGYVLVDKNGKAHVCEVSVDEETIVDFEITGVDMSKVVSCAFCDNSRIVYLATEGKIYAILMSGDIMAMNALSWSPDDPNEVITDIQQYHQGWYGTRQIFWGDYEFPLTTNRLQVIITTYNASTGEGKFYLRPFNINTGKFTYKSNGVYGGFGEITAITATTR